MQIQQKPITREQWITASPLKLVTFIALFLPAIWMASELLSGNWSFPSPYIPLIYHSGVWATYLLLLSLLVTPLRRILRWNALIKIRRMVGVAALFYTLAHLVAWFGLRNWDVGILANELVGRPTLMVASVSLLGLLALGATSFDAAIRYMGALRWNQLHRTIYVLAALAVLHFLLSPGSVAGLPFFVAGSYFWLMAWRVLHRFRLGDRPSALLGLAIVTALLTLLFEPVWVGLYQGTDALSAPLEALAYNFDLTWWSAIGIPPVWMVLGLGILAALAAGLSGRLRARTAPSRGAPA